MSDTRTFVAGVTVAAELVFLAAALWLFWGDTTMVVASVVVALVGGVATFVTLDRSLAELPDDSLE
ncbi:MAG: hypothetical protein ABEJ22_07515 [Haloferacaceae archaeon]